MSDPRRVPFLFLVGSFTLALIVGIVVGLTTSIGWAFAAVILLGALIAVGSTVVGLVVDREGYIRAMRIAFGGGSRNAPK